MSINLLYYRSSSFEFSATEIANNSRLQQARLLIQLNNTPYYNSISLLNIRTY